MQTNEEIIGRMIGQTFSRVEGGTKGDEEMVFYREDGSGFRFFHSQNCCEGVNIEDVCGDIGDLVGTPILSASEDAGVMGPPPDGAESFTWTFYTFRTIRGTVTVRWLGESNGYYSEEVDIKEFSESSK